MQSKFKITPQVEMNIGKKKSHFNWRPFQEARAFARGLGLRNYAEWRSWAKSDARPDDIPAYPNAVCENNGWISWGDWLGTGRIATFNKIYRPFNEARAFVHTLGLKSRKEWNEWARSDARPEDMPIAPRSVYKENG